MDGPKDGKNRVHAAIGGDVGPYLGIGRPFVHIPWMA